jgi:UDP-glucose 4-epimerase
MRIVVTGASGNIGTALVRRLCADPTVDEVVGIARRRPDWSTDTLRWVSADVAVDDLEPTFVGADAVVHLAWLLQPSHDEATLWRTNVAGSELVFEAAARAGVGALIHASSVGAYSAAPKDEVHDETWPTHGVATSAYSRHKAYVERMLDTIEADHPELRVVRVRPALVLQREAASHVRRVFLGPLVPTSLARRSLFPLLPKPAGLRFQVVHSDDVADALALAAVRDVRGAFNLAADPVVDAEVLGRILGARPVPFPGAALRALADLTWRLRLQPADPGWYDMLTSVPVMDVGRAQRELGWRARRDAEDAIEELLGGMADQEGADTPPLRPYDAADDGPGALATGVGGSDPVHAEHR